MASMARDFDALLATSRPMDAENGLSQVRCTASALAVKRVLPLKQRAQEVHWESPWSRQALISATPT
jgi:hypothetical protein